jgi:hypothetical protein
MAEVKKARIFLRRGTDASRKTTTLCEGELGYSTDAFRVFVGDGVQAGGNPVGITAFVSGAANFHTDLDAATVSAYPGDFAVFPAASYPNPVTTTSYPTTSSATVLMLTGDDPAAHGSWVAINSGIPYGNLDIQDNDVSGDKIHGGNISGNVAISAGTLDIGGQASDTLYLSGIGKNAFVEQQFSNPAGSNVIYPLGITQTSQVTCIDSIFGFGVQSEGGIGNALGYVGAREPTTTSYVISGYKSGNNIAEKSTLGTAGNKLSSLNIFTQYMAMSGIPAVKSTVITGNRFFPASMWTDFDSDGENVNVSEIEYNLADFIAATNQASLTWGLIEEFQFNYFGVLDESKAGFMGYYNALIGRNIPLEYVVTNAHRKHLHHGPSISLVRIPNTFNASDGQGANGNGEYLKIHIGNCPNSVASFILTGLKVKT